MTENDLEQSEWITRIRIDYLKDTYSKLTRIELMSLFVQQSNQPMLFFSSVKFATP